MTNKEKVISYPDTIETRVALLEAAIVGINQTLIRIETKIDRQFDDLKSDIKDIRRELKDIRRDMASDFRWTLTIIAALGGIMAHGFHWF
jgi:uncharacterized coiled-coil protein SlyX